MAIEDFEWEGELELTQPSRARLQEQAATQRAGSWLGRLQKSVWLEPALKLGGMALLLGALAGIGVLATTYAKPGIQLPEGPRSLAMALGSSWLKPTPVERDEHAPKRAAVAAAPGAPSAALAVAATAPSAQAPSAAPAAGTTADGRIILNVASAEELTKLPGVGVKRAEAIVALRTKLKRFRQVTDLLRVKGIGPRGLKRMLPHLVLDAP